MESNSWSASGFGVTRLQIQTSPGFFGRETATKIGRDFPFEKGGPLGVLPNETNENAISAPFRKRGRKVTGCKML